MRDEDHSGDSALPAEWRRRVFRMFDGDEVVDGNSRIGGKVAGAAHTRQPAVLCLTSDDPSETNCKAKASICIA